MKKLFLELSMLLFLLCMSINTAWAGSNMEAMLKQLPDEAQEQIMGVLQNPLYFAQLTGYASTPTGGGKVYVSNSVSDDPRGNSYVEGTSNVSVNGMGMSMAGMTKIGITAWAKPDPGYYLAGWSYSNTGTDLGVQSNGQPEGVYLALYDIGIQENETLNYVIYATFEPIRVSGFEVSGNTNLENGTSTQTVTFTIPGSDIDSEDFKAPRIESSVGGGSWNAAGLTQNGETFSVEVTFTAPNTDPAEYSADLVLESEAGIKTYVPLYARTPITGVQAIRYDKNGVEKGRGDLTEMLLAANSTDVVKLCEQYTSPLTITKSVTLDLNGYNLQVLNNTAITVDGGATLTLGYSQHGGQIQGLQQQGILVKSGSKAILKGGTVVNNNIGVKVEEGAELELNGATVAGNTTAAIDNAGKVTTAGGEVIGLVKTSGEFIAKGGSFRNIDENLANMNHTGGPAIQIEGGSAQIKQGDFTGKTYGIYSKGTADVTVEKLAVIEGTPALHAEGNSKITVNCGKFVDPALLFANPANPDEGIEMVSMFFKENNNDLTAIGDKKVWRNTAGSEYRDGYKYFGGTAAEAKKAGVSVCHIGGSSFSSLEDALARANNSSENVTIIMDNDYTLPAGFYTLPANATLIIPNSNEQGAANPLVLREETLSTPTLFRKLTLENGVNMNVFGTIELSGTQYADNNPHTGAVTGDYAQLQMNKGSRMTLQNGSVLRAWGFVTGDVENKNEAHNVPAGEIDARRGASVYEMFQMGDWGNTTANAIGLVTKDTRFPINSYFIQNVEVPVKYHPGAKLTAVTAVAIPGLVKMCANDIQIIGVTNQDVAMFLMDAAADAENTWVRKWYDASKDQQVYEINSGAHIGNLVINLASSPLLEGLEGTLASLKDAPGILGTLGKAGVAAQNMGAHFEQDLVMNSGQYVLPITFNFKLHLLSGTLDFTQNAALIPGSELEIDKEARVFVTDQNDDNVLEGSLYIYDYNDWGESNRKVNYTPSFDDGENNGNVPDDVRDVSSAYAMGHAKVNVHGTFDTSAGYIFTTATGGNIFSSVGDAGTFKFSAQGKSDPEEIKKGTSGYVQCYPAWLRNSDKWVESNGGDEEFRYVKTEGTQQDRSYCYLDIDGRGGRWTLLEQRGCFTYDGASDIYYIKPQEYVAVNVQAEWDEENKEFTSLKGNDDHTFSDAASAGRLFILIDDEDNDCQWWEVEQLNNRYHCTHPDNNTYYTWNETSEKWEKATFTITWKDRDWENDPKQEKILATYEVPYGTMAVWNTTDPIRPASIDYTYTFSGWAPKEAVVTDDVTYMATYKQDTIKYTIIFRDGDKYEEHQWPRGATPVCENEPTRPGYTLTWEPRLASVTKNQTYEATWKLNPPQEETVIFYDYDGVTELDRGTFEVGTMPVYKGSTPAGKKPTLEYSYTFSGWTPARTKVAPNATVYTAVYTEKPQSYTISYFKEDGTTPISTQTLEYGKNPTPPAVTKEAPEDGYTYTYVWQNIVNGKNIEMVTADAGYKPVFTATKNKYTVTLRTTVPNACVFTGAGIYEYGDEVAVSVEVNDDYEFVKWQETGSTDAAVAPRNITEDITLTAVVKEKNKPALKNLELGLTGQQEVSSPTDYMDVTITSNGINASSQIINADNITLYGNADYVLQQPMSAGVWYSVAVPWRVEANGGIYLGNSSKPAVLGTDIEIIYYDGAERARNGKVDACWVWMKKISTKKILEPGRAYMFLIRHGSISKVTFRKKVQEPLLTLGTSVQQYSSQTGDEKDANWNAIANPSLLHAYINAGANDAEYGINKGQVYDAENERYVEYDMDSKRLVVGQPIYVQAAATKSIVANPSSYAAAPARRVNAQIRPTNFELSLSANGTSLADKLTVRLNENKEENAYVIGQDLVKFGVSTKVAQMWIDRYNAKLCVNTVAPESETTSFPLGIYAPKAGNYTIAIEHAAEADDYALYLTKNGEVIANLSDGAYTLDLQKGTTPVYGLSIYARVPQVATDLGAAVVDADGKTTKVLYNGQVFIIRGEKVYSVDGQLVK